MKIIALFFFAFSLSVSATVIAQDSGGSIDKKVESKFATIRDLKVRKMSDLVANILSVSRDKKEQLQLLLVWANENMKADSARFFSSGYPLTVDRALAEGIGLCDEYSAIVEAFCNAAKIQNIRVPGYVKYPGFLKGGGMSQTNHIWNVVYIDSWMACDLFWSVVALDQEGNFIKRLEPKYFLAPASAFAKTHLPADPVFQLNEHPVTVTAFKANGKEDESEKTMPFVNYKDSLNSLLYMTPDARALRMAAHAYAYNKDNPNELIKESFNAGVTIINSGTMTKKELLIAKTHFNRAISLINYSKDSDIKELKEQCIRGLSLVDKRLVKAK